MKPAVFNLKQVRQNFQGELVFLFDELVQLVK